MSMADTLPDPPPPKGGTILALNTDILRTVFHHLDKAVLSLASVVCKAFVGPARAVHEQQERAKKRFAFSWVHTRIPMGWLYPWFQRFRSSWIIQEKGALLCESNATIYFVKNAKPIKMANIDASIFNIYNAMAVVLARNRFTYLFNEDGASYRIRWETEKYKELSSPDMDACFNSGAVVEYRDNIISFCGAKIVVYDPNEEKWRQKNFDAPREFHMHLQSRHLYVCKNSNGVFLFHFEEKTLGLYQVQRTLDHVIMYTNEDPLGYDHDTVIHNEDDNDYEPDFDKNYEQTDKMITIHTTGARPSYRGDSFSGLCSVYCVRDSFVFLSGCNPRVVTTVYVFTPTLINGVWHGLFTKLPMPDPVFDRQIDNPDNFLFHVTADAVSYNFRSHGRWELRVEDV